MTGRRRPKVRSPRTGPACALQEFALSYGARRESMGRRSGWPLRYVATRQSHSAGPKRKRFSHACDHHSCSVHTANTNAKTALRFTESTSPSAGCQDEHAQHRLRQVVGQRHPPGCAQALLEPVVRAVVPEDDEAHVSQRGGDRAKRVGNLADEGYLAGVVVHCGFLSRTDETAPDANAVPPQPKPTVTDELVPGNKQLYVPSVLNAAPG